MESIEYLSKDILRKYCGRKKEGVIALLIDVNKKEIYPIPKGVEHVQLAALILGKRKNELEKNPALAAHLIPSTIEIKEGEVRGVLTGVSGLELGLKVRHKKSDLPKAHAIAWSCINLSVQVGTITVGRLEINRIKIF